MNVGWTGEIDRKGRWLKMQLAMKDPCPMSCEMVDDGPWKPLSHEEGERRIRAIRRKYPGGWNRGKKQPFKRRQSTWDRKLGDWRK